MITLLLFLLVSASFVSSQDPDTGIILDGPPAGYYVAVGANLTISYRCPKSCDTTQFIAIYFSCRYRAVLPGQYPKNANVTITWTPELAYACSGVATAPTYEVALVVESAERVLSTARIITVDAKPLFSVVQPYTHATAIIGAPLQLSVTCAACTAANGFFVAALACYDVVNNVNRSYALPENSSPQVYALGNVSIVISADAAAVCSGVDVQLIIAQQSAFTAVTVIINIRPPLPDDGLHFLQPYNDTAIAVGTDAYFSWSCTSTQAYCVTDNSVYPIAYSLSNAEYYPFPSGRYTSYPVNGDIRSLMSVRITQDFLDIMDGRAILVVLNTTRTRLTREYVRLSIIGGITPDKSLLIHQPADDDILYYNSSYALSWTCGNCNATVIATVYADCPVASRVIATGLAIGFNTTFTNSRYFSGICFTSTGATSPYMPVTLRITTAGRLFENANFVYIQPQPHISLLQPLPHRTLFIGQSFIYQFTCRTCIPTQTMYFALSCYEERQQINYSLPNGEPYGIAATDGVGTMLISSAAGAACHGDTVRVTLRSTFEQETIHAQVNINVHADVDDHLHILQPYNHSVMVIRPIQSVRTYYIEWICRGCGDELVDVVAYSQLYNISYYLPTGSPAYKLNAAYGFMQLQPMQSLLDAMGDRQLMILIQERSNGALMDFLNVTLVGGIDPERSGMVITSPAPGTYLHYGDNMTVTWYCRTCPADGRATVRLYYQYDRTYTLPNTADARNGSITFTSNDAMRAVWGITPSARTNIVVEVIAKSPHENGIPIVIQPAPSITITQPSYYRKSLFIGQNNSVAWSCITCLPTQLVTVAMICPKNQAVSDPDWNDVNTLFWPNGVATDYPNTDSAQMNISTAFASVCNGTNVRISIAVSTMSNIRSTIDINVRDPPPTDQLYMLQPANFTSVRYGISVFIEWQCPACALADTVYLLSRSAFSQLEYPLPRGQVVSKSAAHGSESFSMDKVYVDIMNLADVLLTVRTLATFSNTTMTSSIHSQIIYPRIHFSSPLSNSNFTREQLISVDWSCPDCYPTFTHRLTLECPKHNTANILLSGIQVPAVTGSLKYTVDEATYSRCSGSAFILSSFSWITDNTLVPIYLQPPPMNILFVSVGDGFRMMINRSMSISYTCSYCGLSHRTLFYLNCTSNGAPFTYYLPNGIPTTITGPPTSSIRSLTIPADSQIYQRCDMTAGTVTAIVMSAADVDIDNATVIANFTFTPPSLQSVLQSDIAVNWYPLATQYVYFACKYCLLDYYVQLQLQCSQSPQTYYLPDGAPTIYPSTSSVRIILPATFNLSACPTSAATPNYQLQLISLNGTGNSSVNITVAPLPLRTTFTMPVSNNIFYTNFTFPITYACQYCSLTIRYVYLAVTCPQDDGTHSQLFPLPDGNIVPRRPSTMSTAIAFTDPFIINYCLTSNNVTLWLISLNDTSYDTRSVQIQAPWLIPAFYTFNYTSAFYDGTLELNVLMQYVAAADYYVYFVLSCNADTTYELPQGERTYYHVRPRVVQEYLRYSLHKEIYVRCNGTSQNTRVTMYHANFTGISRYVYVNIVPSSPNGAARILSPYGGPSATVMASINDTLIINWRVSHNINYYNCTNIFIMSPPYNHGAVRTGIAYQLPYKNGSVIPSNSDADYIPLTITTSILACLNASAFSLFVEFSYPRMESLDEITIIVDQQSALHVAADLDCSEFRPMTLPPFFASSSSSSSSAPSTAVTPASSSALSSSTAAMSSSSANSTISALSSSSSSLRSSSSSFVSAADLVSSSSTAATAEQPSSSLIIDLLIAAGVVVGAAFVVTLIVKLIFHYGKSMSFKVPSNDSLNNSSPTRNQSDATDHLEQPFMELDDLHEE